MKDKKEKPKCIFFPTVILANLSQVNFYSLWNLNKSIPCASDLLIVIDDLPPIPSHPTQLPVTSVWCVRMCTVFVSRRTRGGTILHVIVLGHVGKTKQSHEMQLATVFLYSAHRFVLFLFLFLEVNSLASFSFGFHFKELVSTLQHF